MTRLRIEGSERVLFWEVVKTAFGVSAVLFLLGQLGWLLCVFVACIVCLFFGRPWSEAWALGDWWVGWAVIAVPPIILHPMISFFMYLTCIQWIEIGDRLAYHQWGRTQSLDWSDVEALYFSHGRHYYADDDGKGSYPRTDFVVGLRDDSKSVTVRVYKIDEAPTRILHTLTENLRAGDASIRLAAVRALSRFRPDQLPIEEELKEHSDEELDSLKSDLQASKTMLEVTVCELERAMRDNDEEVRNAAREAFDRMRSNLGLTGGPQE